MTLNIAGRPGILQPCDRAELVNDWIPGLSMDEEKEGTK